MTTSIFSRCAWSPKETRFGLVMLFFALLAFALPPFSQPQNYHHFADDRSFFGLTRAMDVLSNFGFLLAGAWGLAALVLRKAHLGSVMACSLGVFFSGVLLTALGSAYYHSAPQDARLVWDRLPMTLAFAGTCGALGCARVGAKAGFISLAASLCYGVASILVWQSTGNLTPYAVMQFGGLAWVAVAWVAGKRGSFDLPWGPLLGFYLAAKIFEALDTVLYTASSHFVSGHTVKHLLSALAAASFARAIWNLRSPIASKTQG